MVLVQGHDEDMQHPLWLEMLRTSNDHQNVLSHHQTSTAANKKMVMYSGVQGDDELQLMYLVHSALLTRQCCLLYNFYNWFSIEMDGNFFSLLLASGSSTILNSCFIHIEKLAVKRITRYSVIA